MTEDTSTQVQWERWTRYVIIEMDQKYYLADAPDFDSVYVIDGPFDKREEAAIARDKANGS